MPTQSKIVAVTSLAREAMIARGNGVSVVCSQSSQLHAALGAAIDPGVSGIISFGISGGLNPKLVAGDWVVATAVRYRGRAIATESGWTQELFRRLPGAVLAEIVGSDTLVPDPSEKSYLYKSTGAAAVDMESHIAAEIAAERKIPFAACRVIIDSAERTLPPVTALALDASGTVNLLAVMRSILRSPGQLPALLRTAADACIAERALRKGRKWLGEGLGSPAMLGRADSIGRSEGRAEESDELLRSSPPVFGRT
ncbi:MAG TPA: phosphorylase [Pseudolabrys sp.]|nr:phosphorylase [Pseudolabrys sp.]